MDQPAFRVGDLVMVADLYARPHDRGVTFCVTRILTVNIVAEPVQGGRPIKGKPDLFIPAPANAATTATVTTIPYLPPLHSGQVVTIAGPGWRQPAQNLYVVLRESPDGKVKLARLGGENGRYWPSSPAPCSPSSTPPGSPSTRHPPDLGAAGPDRRSSAGRTTPPTAPVVPARLP